MAGKGMDEEPGSADVPVGMWLLRPQIKRQL